MQRCCRGTGRRCGPYSSIRNAGCTALLHCLLQGPCIFLTPLKIQICADSQLWFQELHAALLPRHREALRAVYLVHPRSHWAATRGWLYILRSQEAAVYGKVR